MYAKLTKPLDVMAAVVDKNSKAVECLDVDCIQVISITINHIAKIAQFVLAFGGCDSTGRFHLCPQRRENMSQVTIANEKFNEYFLVDGNPRMDFPESFMNMLFERELVGASNDRAWGLDELEVTLQGKSIYKKQKS